MTRQYRFKNFISGLTHFWKDLLLLVMGVYLALWMENNIQSWNENQKQKQYMLRLAEDLKSDIQQMTLLKAKLDTKINKLESSIQRIQGDQVNASEKQAQTFIMDLANTVSTYYFFDPQEFTYLSMRESGDFKLIDSESIKTRLIKLYSQYETLALYQHNYQQGLDDEFIPLWVRSVDMLNQQLLDLDLLDKPLFINMVAFAYIETTARHDLITQIIVNIKNMVVTLEQEAAGI